MLTGAQIALAVTGPVVHAASWLLVRWQHVSILQASGITMTVLGVGAAAVGPVSASRRLDELAAVGIGLAAGMVLYGATVAFMVPARRVPAVASHTRALYREGADRSRLTVLAASVLLSAPGEELLWRGVVLGVLVRALGSAGLAALLGWAAYVVVSAISGRIPIVLGAVVGGGAWTALAWWTGGVAASIACHAVWTGLMVVAPPPGARP